MEGNKVLVNGVNLHYVKVGHGNHTLLLIPGSFGTIETDFKPQLEKLNHDLFTLIAFDPRGYGKSCPPVRDFPLDYLYRDAYDAAGLMQVLGFETYSILGWSDGGNSACILAAKWPERVKKLVIWGTNSYLIKQDFVPCSALRDLNNWSARMRKSMLDAYRKDYFVLIVNRWVDCYEEMEKLLDENGETDLYRNELPKISCNTLIIHGSKDALVPTFHAEYINKHIKNTKLVVWDDGKHNIHLRFADKFNSLVEQFLTTSKL